MLLDVIRGVAIFGILMVNVEMMSLPMSGAADPGPLRSMPPGELVAFLVTKLGFTLKFITIFSILFGASLQLISHKAWRQEEEAEPLLIRRLGVLAAFGLAHALGLWFGDILFQYAIAGLLLAVTTRWDARVLLTLAGLAFLASLPLSALPALSVGFAGSDPSEQAVYATGTFLEIARERASTWFGLTSFVLLVFLPRLAATFWLGMALVKLGVLVQPAAHRRTFRWFMAAGFPVGALMWIAELAIRLGQERQMVADALCLPVQMVGSAGLALAYIGALAWLLERGWLGWLWRRFAAVGRMALTNYLLHSIIFTTLMYSYGLGLFGSLPRAELSLLVLAVVALQLIASPVWLAHFQFGPAEWLWRSLTYGQLQPMLRAG
jgi:uncharacterized protein